MRGVLKRVTSERARQLLLARTSARYLDRLVSGLQQKGSQEAKFRRRASVLIKRSASILTCRSACSRRVARRPSLQEQPNLLRLLSCQDAGSLL